MNEAVLKKRSKFKVVVLSPPYIKKKVAGCGLD
jgi:hypothetical protein